MLKHIMFDLDGTLLAIGLEDLIKTYMGLLGKKMAGLGYDPELTIKAVWAGTYAMLKNDGNRTNREVFWETFSTFNLGDTVTIEQQVDSFYTNEFRGVRGVLREERNLRELIDGLKEKGYTLSLATSPIFPMVGVKERLSWIGLSAEDFGVVTSYENCHFAKPELGYYKEVLNAAGFTAGESLMVGNDLKDDMPAGELGVQTFLVTDVLENKQEGFEEKYTHGTFSQLKEFLENLPDIKG